MVTELKTFRTSFQNMFLTYKQTLAPSFSVCMTIAFLNQNEIQQFSAS